MRFGVLFGFIFHHKKQRSLKKKFISAHHSSPSSSTMDGSSSSSQKYVALERTLFTPVDKLDVQCETFVDFDSIAENGFDFREAVKFQGWEKFFERLPGPVYPTLVKEFWIHAWYPKVVLSSVMGTKLMVTEELLRKLFGYNHEDVDYLPPARRDLNEVHAEVFVSGEHSNKIKDLKPHYKLWAKILIGCIFHRKIQTLQITSTMNRYTLCTVLEPTEELIFHMQSLNISVFKLKTLEMMERREIGCGLEWEDSFLIF